MGNNIYSELTGIHSAQYNITDYYRRDTQLPTIKRILNDDNIYEEILPPYIRYILQLVYLYNMRISELLNCRYDDIISGDRLLVKGLKGSNSYIIYIPDLEFRSHAKDIENKSQRIFNVSYQKIYTWAKKARIGESSIYNKNIGRTHRGRYEIATTLQRRKQLDAVSSVLHHKTEKSKIFYIKQKEANNGKD